MSEGSPYRYMAWVLVAMVPCFGLWYALGTLPAAPAYYLARFVLEWALPDVIQTIRLDGTNVLVMSQFGELDGEIVPAARAGHQLAFPVDTRLLSFSAPFFAALLFASRVSQSLERFCRGLLVLWLLMGLGLVSVTLKNLMVGLGEAFYAAPSPLLPPPELVALLYQLNTLIVPTLAPVLLWIWMARDSALLTRIWARYNHLAPPSDDTV